MAMKSNRDRVVEAGEMLVPEVPDKRSAFTYLAKEFERRDLALTAGHGDPGEPAEIRSQEDADRLFGKGSWLAGALGNFIAAERVHSAVLESASAETDRALRGRLAPWTFDGEAQNEDVAIRVDRSGAKAGTFDLAAAAEALAQTAPAVLPSGCDMRVVGPTPEPERGQVWRTSRADGAAFDGVVLEVHDGVHRMAILATSDGTEIAKSTRALREGGQCIGYQLSDGRRVMVGERRRSGIGDIYEVLAIRAGAACRIGPGVGCDGGMVIHVVYVVDDPVVPAPSSLTADRTYYEKADGWRIEVPAWVRPGNKALDPRRRVVDDPREKPLGGLAERATGSKSGGAALPSGAAFEVVGRGRRGR